MTRAVEVQVNKKDFREVRIVEPEAVALLSGEVRVAIEKFVSYAIGGDDMYWQFYPADDEWGVVPVWGVATVTESQNPDAPVGTRLHGFYPMANTATLRLQKKNDMQFKEVSDYRVPLFGLYNEYGNVTNNPKEMMDFENASCLFVIFMTSYCVADYCDANDFFNAEQIVVSSVSSKTGFGVAKL
uniref:DUF2855 family protein n=1 Tax=Litorivivens sp. TaxID=2020868 RepID=UPI00356569BA